MVLLAVEVLLLLSQMQLIKMVQMVVQVLLGIRSSPSEAEEAVVDTGNGETEDERRWTEVRPRGLTGGGR